MRVLVEPLYVEAPSRGEQRQVDDLLPPRAFKSIDKKCGIEGGFFFLGGGGYFFNIFFQASLHCQIMSDSREQCEFP